MVQSVSPSTPRPNASVEGSHPLLPCGVQSRNDWKRLQQAIVKEHAVPSQVGAQSLAVLVASPVSDMRQSVALFRESLASLTQSRACATLGDTTFRWWFFHHDSQNSLWARDACYRDSRVVLGRSIAESAPAGSCKPAFWLRYLDADAVRRHDYVWLKDEDLGLGLFSWPVYKAVLLLYRPLVSQPAVVAAVEGGRATDITDLRIGRTCPTLPRWREVCQSEVQTPILATSIWPAIRARLETHDNRSNWNIDLFWSLLAMLRRRCVAGARDLLVVDAAPVTHVDMGTLWRRSGKTCGRVSGAVSRHNTLPMSPELRQLSRHIVVRTPRGAAGNFPISRCPNAVDSAWKNASLLLPNLFLELGGRFRDSTNRRAPARAGCGVE